MDKDKIEKTIDYYTTKLNGLRNFINSKSDLTVEEIIMHGEQLAILDYKLTALEIAKEN
ncbi:hypothetical protein [Aestuariivivens sediminicola]|uniref:hypothetical protein n=1 Tax=Aestuariivivens sediminicola TaxID=2913560 RepID=UPI001F581B8E|nr:hypothetical protein [Aestuariivivens sediminicola]